MPQPLGVRTLIIATIIRLIFSVGLQPTLFLLGAFNVCNKTIFLMSFVGNRGTFTRGYKAMILDVEFLYHLMYLIICSLGVFVHVFFYSLLVSTSIHLHIYILYINIQCLAKVFGPLNFATFCHISGFKHKDTKLYFFVKNQQQVGHNHEVERNLLDISNFFN
ncbi:unnamed protein product [Oncorhynchus mykiss]|uniref:Uncharacterized protein n=1 Tax=Oncorhynchus mykiss TaxID=8022 RepID=A0A060Z9C2_ONCMY|nr:unnamed protein product [Oncorhynchus mykiss]